MLASSGAKGVARSGNARHEQQGVRHDSGTWGCGQTLHRWIKSIGLDDTAYGTHTMRRTKASLIYRRTKNLRAVQLLLGHTKLESTLRYLGIEVDDALEMAEQTGV